MSVNFMHLLSNHSFDIVCFIHLYPSYCLVYPQHDHLCKSMFLLKRRYSRLSERQNSWPSIPPLEILFGSSCWINYNDDISCLCDNWFMLCSLITSVILEETFFIIFTHFFLPQYTFQSGTELLDSWDHSKMQIHDRPKCQNDEFFPTHHSNLCDLASIATSSKGRAHCRSLEPVRRCRFLLRAVKSCTKKSRWVDGFFTKLDSPLLPIPNFVFTGSIFGKKNLNNFAFNQFLRPLFKTHRKSLESKHEIFSVKKYGNLGTFCHHQTNNLAKNTTH